nr:hypothetical protein [Tanacetum cinerariifolium]
TFGDNEATKKRKKNLLKQQYGNFKAEGAENLEQTFNRLQVIALMAINGVGWDWSYMANKGEDHALVADGEAPTEFALMANTESKVFDNSLCLNEYKELKKLKLQKDGLDGKLVGLLKASKNLVHLIESQRSDQKDLSWTGLPEFVDDIVTDYSRPSPTIASTSAEGQNKDSSTSEDVASPNPPKPFVKFVKPKDSQPESKTKEQETPKKPQVKYAEHYRCWDFTLLDDIDGITICIIVSYTRVRLGN